MFAVLVIPTGEAVTLPGNRQDTKDIFSIDGYETASMETIYVINYEPLTYFQRAILDFSSRADIQPITEYEASLSQLDMFRVGQIQKESAYHMAVITAYQKAEKYIDFQLQGYALVSVPNATSNLQIGDIIININGMPLTLGTSLSQFINDEVLSLVIIRDEQVIETTYYRNKDDIPLYVYPLFQINDMSPSINLNGLTSLIGGPSSGMMMTLSIYATLMEYTIHVKLAGTGTIEFDGRIGRIGGLLQKYYNPEKKGNGRI